MIFLARGLWERIDTAWYGALALFCLGAIFSLTRELALINAILLIMCALLLIPCKSAFNRRSNLFSLAIDPLWAGMSLVTLGLLIWGGFYAYKHVPYAHSLWIDFSYRAAASRFLRALVLIALTVVLLGLYPPVRHRPSRTAPAGRRRYRPVARGGPAGVRSAGLAGPVARQAHPVERGAHRLPDVWRLGQAVGGDGRGRSGPESEAGALCWKLKEMASLSNARLSFYQISPKTLPLVLDLGLRPFKIGEEACVDVAAFDLAGRKGYGFRQTLKRFDGLKAAFEVIPA